MRLLCDEMLARLGRWLRAAGYDTAIAVGGEPDLGLIGRCAVEGRILVTRDAHLAAAAAASVPTVRLVPSRLECQARALRQALAIDWQCAPFSRCLVDNTPLVPAPEASAEVPPASRAAGGPLRRCPHCDRLYWPGGHVRRMQGRLAAWNRI